eukprot:scaffold31143_cov18-Tisochrysis_lutea.AAC.5
MSRKGPCSRECIVTETLLASGLRADCAFRVGQGILLPCSTPVPWAYNPCIHVPSWATGGLA